MLVSKSANFSTLNLRGLTGNVNGLTGNVNGLTGNVSGLIGNVNGLTGNVNGLTGNADGLTGNAGFLKKFVPFINYSKSKPRIANPRHRVFRYLNSGQLEVAQMANRKIINRI